MDLRKLKIIKNNLKNIFCSLVFIFSFLFFPLFSPHSLAADSLSYSGRLVKADGSPVTGPVDLKIELAYTNAPGTILCSQNFSSVALSNGVFHLKLDLVCPGPPVKTLTEILTAVPATFAAALRVSDLTNTKIYAFQEIHSMPFATVSESAKQLAQLGAVNGEVLKWNDTTKKWEPSAAGGGGTVTNVTASAPLAVASGGTTPALTISKATTLSDGYLSATDWNTFNNKVGVATGGTLSQYYRGDNSWQTLNSDAVPVGTNNLYFSNALALGVPLGASLDVALTGAITSSDTILSAFGRAQNQLTTLSSNSSAYVTKTGNSAVSGTIDARTGFVLVGPPGTLNDATPKTYVDNQDNLKVNKAGDTITGVLILNSDLQLKGGSNYVTLKAHATTTADYNFILPQTAGSAGEVLKTDGAGNLAWINPSSVATGTNTVNSASIVDGTIVDADVATGAAIAQSKINGLETDLAGKEPTLVNPNDTTKYYRADKSWQTLNSSVVPEGTNLYFTEARVLGTDLLGLSTIVAGPIADTDSVLGAFGKLQYQVNDLKAKGQWEKNVNDIYYNTGKVGVGTTTPSTLLDVKGSLKSEVGGTNSVLFFKFDPSSATPGMTIGPPIAPATIPSANYLTVGSKDINGVLRATGPGSTRAIYIPMSSQSTSADYGVDIDITANNFSTPFGVRAVVASAPSAANPAYGFYSSVTNTTGAAYAFYANQGISYFAGNVGIGAPVPAEKLHVVGNANLEGKLRLKSDNVNYVELSAPAALAATLNYIFPGTAGASGQVLTTNGAGVLSWSTAATTATAVGGDISGTIANAQLVAGAVGTSEISDASIATADLADSSINSAKILDGTIVDADLANATISYAKLNLADGSIPLTKLNGASDATLYLRGDKSWSNFATDAINSTLVGFTPYATKVDIAAGDSIFTAFRKTQKQLDDIDGDYVSKSGNNTVNGTFNISGIAAFLNIPTPTGTTLTEAANVDYVKTYVGTMGQWSKNVSDIYFNTGKVGIGTNTPSDRLTVKALSNATTDYPIQMHNLADTMRTGHGTYGMSNKIGTAQTIDYTFDVGGAQVFKSGGSESMRILSNGKVGMGTATPMTSLEVANTGGAAISIRDNNNLVTDPDFQTYVQGVDSAGSVGWYVGEGSSGQLVGLMASTPGYRLFLGTNGMERLSIVDNGNVGIGMTTPTELLQVNGNISIPYTVSKTQGYKLDLGNDLAYLWRNYSYADDSFFISQNWYANDAGANVIPNNGHSTAAIEMRRGVGINLKTGAINTVPSTKMTIDTVGNVGIGTITPGAKLNISGLGAGDGTALRIDSQDTYKRDILFTEFNNTSYGGIIRYDSGADVFQLLTIEAGVEKKGISIARATGNVGIGTATPTAALEVSGDIKVTGGRFTGRQDPVNELKTVMAGACIAGANGIGGRFVVSTTAAGDTCNAACPRQNAAATCAWGTTFWIGGNYFGYNTECATGVDYQQGSAGYICCCGQNSSATPSII